MNYGKENAYLLGPDIVVSFLLTKQNINAVGDGT